MQARGAELDGERNAVEGNDESLDSLDQVIGDGTLGIGACSLARSRKRHAAAEARCLWPFSASGPTSIATAPDGRQRIRDTATTDNPGATCCQATRAAVSGVRRCSIGSTGRVPAQVFPVRGRGAMLRRRMVTRGLRRGTRQDARDVVSVARVGEITDDERIPRGIRFARQPAHGFEDEPRLADARPAPHGHDARPRAQQSRDVIELFVATDEARRERRKRT